MRLSIKQIQNSIIRSHLNLNLKIKKDVKFLNIQYVSFSNKISKQNKVLENEKNLKQNKILDNENKNKIVNEKEAVKNSKNAPKEEQTLRNDNLNNSPIDTILERENPNILKNKINMEKLNKTLKQISFIVSIPLIYFSVVTFIDSMHLGYIIHYSVQSGIKQINFLNFFNMGILYAIKFFREHPSVDKLTSSDINFRAGAVLLSLILSNILITVPLPLPAFTIFFLILHASTDFILDGLKCIDQNNFRFRIIIGTFSAFLFVAVATNYKDYKTKLSEQNKFEKVISFFELSTDEQFKTLMNQYEPYLNEIDLKIEKRKD